MSAFTVGNALKEQRDTLQASVRKLQAVLAIAGEWIDSLEKDRIALTAEITAHRVQQWTQAKKNLIKTAVSAQLSTQQATALNALIDSTIIVPRTDEHYNDSDTLHTYLTAQDRTALVTALNDWFDATRLTRAMTLNVHFNAETSTTSTVGLNRRIRDALTIKNRILL